MKISIYNTTIYHKVSRNQYYWKFLSNNCFNTFLFHIPQQSELLFVPLRAILTYCYLEIGSQKSLMIFFSQIKYKSDLTWLKGIGCYAYDTPDFTLAEKNKTLYSKVYLLKDGDHIHSTYSSVHRGNSFSYFHPHLASRPYSWSTYSVVHSTQELFQY